MCVLNKCVFMFIRSYAGVGWTKTCHVLNILPHLGSTVERWRASGVGNTSNFCAKGGFFLTIWFFLDDNKWARLKPINGQFLF